MLHKTTLDLGILDCRTDLFRSSILYGKDHDAIQCPLCGKFYIRRPDSILMHLKKHRVIIVHSETKAPWPTEVIWRFVRWDACGCGAEGPKKRYPKNVHNPRPTAWMFEHLKQFQDPAQHLREAAVMRILGEGVRE